MRTFCDLEVMVTSDDSTADGIIGMGVLKYFKIEIQGGKMRLSM